MGRMTVAILLFGAVLTTIAVGRRPAWAGDVQCFARNCYGKHSYQQQCPEARDKARALCRISFTSRECEVYTESAEETCSCASKCVLARCRKFPTGPNPDNDCSDATW